MAKKYKVMLIAITIVLIGSIFLGTSYSLWQASKTQEGVNEISVGCFNITYTNLDSYGGNEAGDINLVNAYPISDEAGSALTPYVFKIKNECTIAANYAINLETLNTSNFNTDYLKVKFNEASNNSSTPTLYKDITVTDVLLSNSTSAKQLTTGYLAANEEITYALRAWIDINATTTTPNVMGKTWNGKVVVSSEAAKDNAVATIKKLVADADSSSTDEIGSIGLAYDGTADNNLRYVGANPNNYVSFNNELWRIIGVMNNIENSIGQTQSLVKIRRAESLGNYSWDTSTSRVNDGAGVNEWSQADLMQELNNDYLGNVTIGTDGNWYSGQNNAKSTAKPSTTISSEAQNQIESVKWNLGSPNNNNGTYVAYDSEDLKAPYVYTHERASTNGKICTSGTYCNDTVTRTSSWTGKVALMYPSDYLYATSGGNATNRAACLNTKQRSWFDTSVSDCKNNDWIYNSSNYQWTLSPFAYSSSAYNVFHVYSSGSVINDHAYHAYGVCPVVFLKSSVQITGGTGTQTDPYTLG